MHALHWYNFINVNGRHKLFFFEPILNTNIMWQNVINTLTTQLVVEPPPQGLFPLSEPDVSTHQHYSQNNLYIVICKCHNELI